MDLGLNIAVAVIAGSLLFFAFTEGHFYLKDLKGEVEKEVDRNDKAAFTRQYVQNHMGKFGVNGRSGSSLDKREIFVVSPEKIGF